MLSLRLDVALIYKVGEDPFEHASGLTDLDQVTVRVAQATAQLGLAVKWFCQELCTFAVAWA